MSPPETLWTLPEHEIIFQGPFDAESKSVLLLTNLSDKRICFKIYTTQPNKYRVGPASGILAPGKSESIISLGLLLSHSNVSALARCKFSVTLLSCDLKPDASDQHYFMIQHFVVHDIHLKYNSETLWKKVPIGLIMYLTLSCAFAGGISGSQKDGNFV